MPQYPLSDTPQHDVADPRVPARANDDQIRARTASNVQDLSGRRPLPALALGLEARAPQERERSSQNRLRVSRESRREHLVVLSNLPE